ncbi:MAG TPA: ATP-dependent DNA helicase RecG [Solirubrobacteraceae bacterium]|jgi:ATP-dependent DNA helicase RecG
MNEHPTGFAGSGEPTAAELLGASVRTPRPSRLSRPLALAPKALEGARALGLHDVGALLEHVPRARREARTVAALAPGETATVVVEVRSIASRSVRRRGMRPLVEATVADETGPMKATFFNQPWLVSRYRPGTRLVLHGKLEGRNRFRVSTHATTEEAASSGEEVSHYAATEGLSSTQILALVNAERGCLREIVDPLPGRLRGRLALAERGAALEAMHFGATSAAVERGRERLAFEELLFTQLALLARRAAADAGAAAAPLDGPGELTERWLAGGLPFTPTGDQSLAIDVLREELAGSRPAQRLLMGEVGSGKTVVALYAMLRAVEHGRQAALMAPTETLAEQHFATIQRLLGAEPVTLELLTGSTPAARRAKLLGRLAGGECSLIVGTHALIEDPVRFDSLAVAVVDEQHRFGVRQRSALVAKAPAGLAPHVLHMTATPIPRTLALCEYGDLDQTRLHERPHGRRPAQTHVVAGERERARAYERIAEEIRAGRQAFVVCPLVDASESDEGAGTAAAARAATEEFERLRDGELRDYRLVLLHGQLGHREKQAAMASFAAGEADVLVSTTVIEVGIDVPNATVMLIENADRFGISQLHQLRGRVGRGEHESLCLLCGPKSSPRLNALALHDDGFELAEIDLRLRKEGELIGTKQSGVGHLRHARLPDDELLLARARESAEAVIAADPALERPEHVLLADRLGDLYGEIEAHPIAA